MGTCSPGPSSADAATYRVTRLSRLFQINEMARTKGALSPAMRIAFDKAKNAGEFSVQDFFGWFTDAGGQSAIGNVGGRIRLYVAEPGESPSAEKPLIVTRTGRRGPGGAAMYRYAFDGTVGAAPKTAKAKSDFDDLWAQHSDDGEDQDSSPQGLERLMPQPDPMGDYAESSMAKLVDAGIGPDDPMWQEIADSDGDVAAGAILRKHSLPPTLMRPALVIGKHLFKGLNKDWDGLGVQAEPANSGSGRKVGEPWKKKAAAEPEPQQEPDAGDTEPDIDIDDLLGDDDWEVATEPDVKAPEPEKTQAQAPQKEPEPEKKKDEPRKIGSWMSKVMKKR